MLVAKQDGLTQPKLGTIVAGQRPSDLTLEEGAAYDVAAALTAGGVLPETTYQAAYRGLPAFWREVLEGPSPPPR